MTLDHYWAFKFLFTTLLTFLTLVLLITKFYPRKVYRPIKGPRSMTGRDIAAKCGWPNVSNPTEVRVVSESTKVRMDLMDHVFERSQRHRELQNMLFRLRVISLSAKRKRRNISTLPTPRRP